MMPGFYEAGMEASQVCRLLASFLHGQASVGYLWEGVSGNFQSFFNTVFSRIYQYHICNNFFHCTFSDLLVLVQ
jgi:hypothetical protein